MAGVVNSGRDGMDSLLRDLLTITITRGASGPGDDNRYMNMYILFRRIYFGAEWSTFMIKKSALACQDAKKRDGECFSVCFARI